MLPDKNQSVMQWIDWPLPTKGMMKDVEPELIPREYWKVCSNALVEAGVTFKLPGVTQLGTLNLGAAVRLITQAERQNKVMVPVFGTAVNLWRYDHAGDVETQITSYAEGTIKLNNGSDQLIAAGTDFLSHIKGSDHTPDQLVIVDGVDVSGTEYLIDSVDSDTQLTLNQNWAGVNVADVAYTIRQRFHEDGMWDSCMFQGSEATKKLYLANGHDPLMRWDPDGGDDFLEICPGSPPICRYVQPFGYYLILGWLVVAGDTYPASIAWPDAGDPTNWTTGDAQARTLSDDLGWIVDLIPLRGRFVIHHEHGQSYLEWLGDPYVFFSGTASYDRGGVGRRTVIAMDNYHLVVGKADIFEFDGAGPIGIGDIYFQKWLAAQYEPDYLDAICILKIPELNRLYIFYPNADVTGMFANKALVYDYHQRTHAECDAPDVTAVGHYDAFTQNFIDDVGDFFDDVDDLFDAADSIAFHPINLIGTNSGKVYQLSGLNDLNGDAITCVLETGVDRLDNPDAIKMISNVRVDVWGAVGTDIEFYIGHKENAFDGFTWKGPYTLPIQGDATDRLQIPQVYGRYFARKFVVSGVNADFKLRGMRVERTIEGER